MFVSEAAGVRPYRSIYPNSTYFSSQSIFLVLWPKYILFGYMDSSGDFCYWYVASADSSVVFFLPGVVGVFDSRSRDPEFIIQDLGIWVCTRHCKSLQDGLGLRSGVVG